MWGAAAIVMLRAKDENPTLLPRSGYSVKPNLISWYSPLLRLDRFLLRFLLFRRDSHKPVEQESTENVDKAEDHQDSEIPPTV